MTFEEWAAPLGACAAIDRDLVLNLSHPWKGLAQPGMLNVSSSTSLDKRVPSSE